MPLRWKLAAAAAGWLLLGLSMWLTAGPAPAAQDPPPLSAVIDCATLRGEGQVRILLHGRPAGVVRVICPPPQPV